MQNRLIAILLPLLLAGQAYGAHISDRLQAGFYAEPIPDSKPLLALPSGTPVEVLAQKEEFSRVRLADNSEGWVASDFITEEKPVREQLLELQADNGSLKRRLQQAEKKLAAAQAETKQLKGELNQEATAAQALNAERSTVSDTDAATRQQTTLWHLALLVASICSAFIGGILYRNNRLAQRFGGLRF